MYNAVALNPTSSLLACVSMLLGVSRARESCLHVGLDPGGPKAIVPMGLKRFEVVCGTGILRFVIFPDRDYHVLLRWMSFPTAHASDPRNADVHAVAASLRTVGS